MCGTSASDSPGVGRDVHAQAVFEPNLLDREVEAQELQLAPQGHFLRVHVVEREAQQVSEPRHHRLGLGRLLLLDEHDDGAERVEEEVRLQLHLQRAQLRRRQLLRELGRLHFQFECLPLADRGVPMRSVDGLERDDRPIPDGAPLNVRTTASL